MLSTRLARAAGTAREDARTQTRGSPDFRAGDRRFSQGESNTGTHRDLICGRLHDDHLRAQTRSQIRCIRSYPGSPPSQGFGCPT